MDSFQNKFHFKLEGPWRSFKVLQGLLFPSVQGKRLNRYRLLNFTWWRHVKTELKKKYFISVLRKRSHHLSSKMCNWGVLGSFVCSLFEWKKESQRWPSRIFKLEVEFIFGRNPIGADCCMCIIEGRKEPWKKGHGHPWSHWMFFQQNEFQWKKSTEPTVTVSVRA